MVGCSAAKTAKNLKGADMKKAEKPEFTDEMRAKLNSMVRLLYKRFYTKQELMEIYNVGERQIRMMITAISHRLPVMSTSGTNNGYKIATSPEELELVENSWAELSSRIEELQKRISPLIKFRDKIKYGVN